VYDNIVSISVTKMSATVFKQTATESPPLNNINAETVSAVHYLASRPTPICQADVLMVMKIQRRRKPVMGGEAAGLDPDSAARSVQDEKFEERNPGFCIGRLASVESGCSER
jgi:hypothetical protein